MADENVVDTACPNIKAEHLLLRAFSAVDQVQTVVNIQALSCGVSIKNGGCRAAAKYSNFKSHTW